MISTDSHNHRKLVLMTETQGFLLWVCYTNKWMSWTPFKLFFARPVGCKYQIATMTAHRTTKKTLPTQNSSMLTTPGTRPKHLCPGTDQPANLTVTSTGTLPVTLGLTEQHSGWQEQILMLEDWPQEPLQDQIPANSGIWAHGESRQDPKFNRHC